MKNILFGLIALCIMVCSVNSAVAQVSIGIGLPNLSIGINLPLYPELAPVPGYPVYYAPQVAGNYFFYDGMYWVYQDDTWYASSWYNGPWSLVEADAVPMFILRIPVRYYRQPPVYFRGWQSNAPPRWGQHWGRDWEQRRGGWDRWNRKAVPSRAPLPVYQRQYSGDRYPRVEQQHTLRNQSYRYQPRDKVVSQHFKQVEQRTPASAQRRGQEEQSQRNQRQQDNQRSAPLQQGGQNDSRSQPSHRGGDNVQRPAPDHTQPQQRGPAFQDRKQPEAAQPEQRGSRVQHQEQKSQDNGESQEPRRGHGQEKDEGRGRERDR